jgi:hypothetical protein
MSIADRTRSKLCNRRRSKRAICSGTLDEKALEIDQNSIVIEHDKIHFTLSDSRDGSFQHESVIEIKPEELVSSRVPLHMARFDLLLLQSLLRVLSAIDISSAVRFRTNSF